MRQPQNAMNYKVWYYATIKQELLWFLWYVARLTCGYHDVLIKIDRNHKNRTYCGVHPIFASYFSHIRFRRTSIRCSLICLVDFSRRNASSFVIVVFIMLLLLLLKYKYT